MKVAVVANPTSGRGKGAALIPRVQAVLRSLGVDHTIHVSQNAADPERLSRTAASDGADVVAALGGDGHVGACANGVLRAGSSAALAVIPAGTGNDFARLIGIHPKEPLAAVEVLRTPTVKRIDAVRLKLPQGERYYVNVAGAGFDSEVNAYANRMRWFRGKTKYAIATFILLPGFRAARFGIAVDGEHHDVPGMLIAVGNGRSYGGGMRVCPDANLDDGVLDVTVVGEVSKPEFIKTFPKVFTGRHVTHPKVKQFRGAQVSITAERTLQVFADGEHAGTLPATFAVLPSALGIVVPPDEGKDAT